MKVIYIWRPTLLSRKFGSSASENAGFDRPTNHHKKFLIREPVLKIVSVKNISETAKKKHTTGGIR